MRILITVNTMVCFYERGISTKNKKIKQCKSFKRALLLFVYLILLNIIHILYNMRNENTFD